MKTPTRPKSYQLGAAHERQAIVSYIKRRIRMLRGHFELTRTLEWIEKRTKRFDARLGGLGRKRKVRVITYVFGAKAAK